MTYHRPTRKQIENPESISRHSPRRKRRNKRGAPTSKGDKRRPYDREKWGKGYDGIDWRKGRGDG
jgi:hypothetical protein